MHEQEYVLSEEDVHALSKISRRMSAIVELFGIFLINNEFSFKGEEAGRKMLERVSKIFDRINEADEADTKTSENASNEKDLLE